VKVDLITETNSDLTVVNAAKCSFDKESEYHNVHKVDNEGCEYESTINTNCINYQHYSHELYDKDVKLIKYLAAHQHWTPFAHPQEVFDIDIQEAELTYFLLRANLAGFEWVTPVNSWTVRGSLYAWLTNTTWLPEDISRSIRGYLYVKYPISYIALKKYFVDSNLGRHVSVIGDDDQTEDELRTYTLRLHVPIFVKRQLETHRRNFVMTDIEDFAQNEVSRRYIDSQPEIYRPKEWRLQAQNRKQGSEGVLQMPHSMTVEMNYTQMEYTSLQHYKDANQKNVAREQSRMVLPLSTYTTFWWTGSVKSWKRLFSLRLAEDAQSETREVAQMCYDVIAATGQLL
jgi:thymidylate synthase (FAD)